MNMPEASLDARRSVLSQFGAKGAALDELLAYNQNIFERHRFGTLPTFPLPDEPHLEAWRLYAAEARELGAIPALRRRLVQLRFPVEPGISQTEPYRDATRRGILPAEDRPPVLLDPAGIELLIHFTMAGQIPVLVVKDRGDFITLVQVFSARNEPEPVPDSMGACIVTGLNNWDRIRGYREAWTASHPSPDENAWDEEFSRIIPRKELYQDRFIILSSGPYSGVPAREVSFAEEQWADLSLAIRLDHECTHYFTLRALGSMRNNLIDELIADYVGLVRTFGEYRGDLALRFFGLEEYPKYREGARLQNYRGTPPLSDAAFDVLKTLVFEAVRNLERFDRSCSNEMREPSLLGTLVIALASMSLEEVGTVSIDRRIDAFFSGTIPGQIPISLQLTTRGELSLVLRNDWSEVEKAVEDFSEFAKSHHLPSGAVSHVNLALDEILSNIIKYGYDDDREHQIRVSIRVDDEMLELEIVDDARPFNILERPDPDTNLSVEERPIGGLGVFLVKRLMDAHSYERREGLNHLILRKKFATG